MYNVGYKLYIRYISKSVVAAVYMCALLAFLDLVLMSIMVLILLHYI